MNHRNQSIWGFPTWNRIAHAALLAGVAALVAAGSPLSMRAQDVRAEASLDVQTRGPVHEAFAQPVMFEAEAGITTTVEPPPAIEETPPDERPAGANVVWIPGYWSWDDESKAYLWVTGCWRDPPPGHTWVAGYWSRDANGWDWTSGFWRANSAAAEVEYLPTPPPTLEEGAPATAPNPEAIWVTGIWVWRDHGYYWRPGYWVTTRPDWVFMPAHYVWTPCGCIFVDAAWDIPIERRGILFAPVAFTATTYPAFGFRFSPLIAIDAGIFVSDCFVRPRCRGYYFGDYYAEADWHRGIYPAYAFHMSRYGYDPVFVSLSIRAGGDRGSHFSADRRDRYERLRDHADARPPRTFAAQERATASVGKNQPATTNIAVTINNYSTTHNTIKMEKSSSAERAQFAKQATAVRSDSVQRQRLETAAAPSRAEQKPVAKADPKAPAKPNEPKSNDPSKAAKPAPKAEETQMQPHKLTLPSSVARPEAPKDAKHPPVVAPPRPEAPAHDPKVRPAPHPDPNAKPKLPEPSVKPATPPKPKPQDDKPKPKDPDHP